MMPPLLLRQADTQVATPPQLRCHAFVAAITLRHADAA